MKSCEVHKNTQNATKFGGNLITYMFVQHVWNLSQLKTVSLKRANNVPKLPAVYYIAKNWALAMMLKALPLVHFWSILLLKEQMMTSAGKTLKMLVWSAQNRSISSEICAKNNHKIGRFLPISLRQSLPRKFPQNSHEIGWFFLKFVPKNPAIFSATY